MTPHKELVVIGGGPGGYAAAFLAADLGMKVTLVEDGPDPGGVCLFRGCIPSKALLHIAKLMGEATAAREFGIEFESPRVNLEKLREWKQSVVNGLTGGLGKLASQRKVEFVRGHAKLLTNRSLKISFHAGESETWTFDRAVLATGSYPTRIPSFPEDPRIWDSTAALNLPTIPQRLLVVGGGYIGLELGSVYAALGSRVTVVEMLPRLLNGVDADLVRPLARRLERVCEEIRLQTSVTAITPTPKALSVTMEDSTGRKDEKYFESMLVAVGRTPRTAEMGLENTDVVLDRSGFVKVNAQMRTAVAEIYAIGDIVGQPMLAHKASHEGRVAAGAIAGQKVAFEPACIPAVVFTDPEIAWCGLTEEQAKADGRMIEITRFPWAASGRAQTLGRSDGMTKLIVDPSSRRILGVGIVGSGADELIAEGALAIEMAALVDDLKLTVHPHPTLSETMMEAAETYFGQATHIYRPRRPRR